MTNQKPSNCPYCNLSECPILNKGEYPIKLLWDRVEEMERKAERKGFHIVNLGHIGEN